MYRRRVAVGLYRERVRSRMSVRSGAWDVRRSLRAAQTSRKKNLEGRLRNGPTYSRHYIRLRDYFLYFGTEQMIFMCYGQPCELAEFSFDSGLLDAIPAYIKRRPTRHPDCGKQYPGCIAFRVYPHCFLLQ